MPICHNKPPHTPAKHPSLAPSKHPSLAPSQHPSLAPSQHPSKTPPHTPAQKDDLKYLSQFLRAHNREYFLCALGSPPQIRPRLIALYALQCEVRRIPKSVSEHALAAIKYQWWRDAIATIANPQNDAPSDSIDHPIIRLLKPYGAVLQENGIEEAIAHDPQNAKFYGSFIKIACAIIEEGKIPQHIPALAEKAGAIIFCAQNQKTPDRLREASRILGDFRERQNIIPPSLFYPFLPLAGAALRIEIKLRTLAKGQAVPQDFGAFFPLRQQWRLFRCARKKRF